MPLALVALPLSLIGGRFLHRVAPRWMIGGGLALIGAGGGCCAANPCRRWWSGASSLRHGERGPVPADARPSSGSSRAARGPHHWTRAITGPDEPRAAGNEPSVLAGRGRRAVRVLGAGSLAGRDADAPRGWNNVTAVDPTVSGVTLWSAAGHDVTCPGATLPACHVWRPTGASGLLRSDALDPHNY